MATQDSYFISLGLIEDGRIELAKGSQCLFFLLLGEGLVVKGLC